MYNGLPRLCSVKIVVIDVGVIMHRDKFFALCKGDQDRNRLIERYRIDLKDRFGDNVDIFIDYSWETLVMTDVTFSASSVKEPVSSGKFNGDFSNIPVREHGLC